MPLPNVYRDRYFRDPDLKDITGVSQADLESEIAGLLRDPQISGNRLSFAIEGSASRIALTLPAAMAGSSTNIQYVPVDDISRIAVAGQDYYVIAESSAINPDANFDSDGDTYIFFVPDINVFANPNLRIARSTGNDDGSIRRNDITNISAEELVRGQLLVVVYNDDNGYWVSNLDTPIVLSDITDLLNGSMSIQESALDTDLINEIRAGSNHHLESVPISLENPNSGNIHRLVQGETYHSSLGSTDWESITVRVTYSEITGDGTVHGLVSSVNLYLVRTQITEIQIPYIRDGDGNTYSVQATVQYDSDNDRLTAHLGTAQDARSNHGPNLEILRVFGHRDASGAVGLDQAAVDARVVGDRSVRLYYSRDPQAATERPDTGRSTIITTGSPVEIIDNIAFHSLTAAGVAGTTTWHRELGNVTGDGTLYAVAVTLDNAGGVNRAYAGYPFLYVSQGGASGPAGPAGQGIRYLTPSEISQSPSVITITTNPEHTLAAGDTFIFMSEGAFTSNPGIIFDGDAHNIVRRDGSRVDASDIMDNDLITMTYDGTNFISDITSTSQFRFFTLAETAQTGNAVTITPNRPFTLSTGSTLLFVGEDTNTGPVTITIDGRTINVINSAGGLFSGGEIVPHQITQVTFDGTTFRSDLRPATSTGGKNLVSVTTRLLYARSVTAPTTGLPASMNTGSGGGIAAADISGGGTGEPPAIYNAENITIGGTTWYRDRANATGSNTLWTIHVTTFDFEGDEPTLVEFGWPSGYAEVSRVSINADNELVVEFSDGVITVTDIVATAQGAVLYDRDQTTGDNALTPAQRQRARDNIDAAQNTSGATFIGPTPVGNQITLIVGATATNQYTDVLSVPTNVGANGRTASYVDVWVSAITPADFDYTDLIAYYRIGPSTYYAGPLGSNGRFVFNRSHYDPSTNSLLASIRNGSSSTAITSITINGQAFESDVTGDGKFVLGPSSYSLATNRYFWFPNGSHYFLDDLDSVVIGLNTGGRKRPWLLSANPNDILVYPSGASVEGVDQRHQDFIVSGWSSSTPIFGRAGDAPNGGSYFSEDIATSAFSVFRFVRQAAQPTGVVGGIYVVSAVNARSLEYLKFYPKSGVVL